LSIHMEKEKEIAGEIAGYRVLSMPLIVKERKGSTFDQGRRYMYAKRHGAAEDATVFLANVPRPLYSVRDDTDAVVVDTISMQDIKELLKQLFESSKVGAVSNISLKRLKGDKYTEASCVWCAHVTFEDASCVDRIFDPLWNSESNDNSSGSRLRSDSKRKKKKMNRKDVQEYRGPLILSLGRKREPRVTAASACAKLFREHLNQYARPERLEAEVNEFIASFESREEQVRLAKERRRNEVDEDGFMLVSRKRQVRHATMHANERKKKKKKKKAEKELSNFYQFQIREKKRDQLATLREKFEADKRRIEQLKASRKFRPY